MDFRNWVYICYNRYGFWFSMEDMVIILFELELYIFLNYVFIYIYIYTFHLSKQFETGEISE